MEAETKKNIEMQKIEQMKKKLDTHMDTITDMETNKKKETDTKTNTNLLTETKAKQ